MTAARVGVGGRESRTHPLVIATGLAAAACAALGAVAIEQGQVRDETTALAAITIVAGVSFVVAGLVAWARRPERWTGALMVGAGFLLFAGTLVQWNHSLPFTIGLAVGAVPSAV